MAAFACSYLARISIMVTVLSATTVLNGAQKTSWTAQTSGE